MKHYSKRVAEYTDQAILSYLQSIGEAIINNNTPQTLETGEKLSRNHFVIDLSYFKPNSDYESIHSNCKFVWFTEIIDGKTVKYFDWPDSHNVSNIFCCPPSDK
jgi:hypothetical protein